MSKGAFNYHEVGAKRMSSSHGMLKSAQGKMSHAHGVVPKNTHNNMDQGGKDRIGEHCRGFKRGEIGSAGPEHFGEHKQPKGNKHLSKGGFGEGKRIDKVD